DFLPILPLVPFVSHSRFVSTVNPFVVTHKGKSATLTRKSPRWSDLPLKHFPLIHSYPTRTLPLRPLPARSSLPPARQSAGSYPNQKPCFQQVAPRVAAPVIPANPGLIGPN